MPEKVQKKYQLKIVGGAGWNESNIFITIKNISRRIFGENNINEEKFWEIVKKGFAHKRKKLSGNLKGVVSDQILKPFLDKRAENLTLLDWISLSK